jgi:O-antigen/teichoic acid export membrane protein
MLGYALSQAVRFGTNLIMARLLVPEMFGVMSIALMVMIGLALFSDIGLRQSVVQNRRGADPLFLDTIWVTKVAFGIAIAVSAALIGVAISTAAHAGLFAVDSAYAARELPWVLAVLGAGAILTGAESTKAFEASRQLTLGRLTRIQLIAQAAGVLVMLAWAILDRSIWVLVAGSLTSSLISLVLSHTWLPGHRNRFCWDRQAYAEILSYGKWVLLSSVLGFFANASDRMLLGALMSANALGVYYIAGMLMNAVENVVTKIIGDVTFPALSEVARERRSRLGTVLYKFHLPLAAFNNLAAGAILIASPAIVAWLYDNRYADAGWMLQILAVGLVAVPFKVHAICLLAVGDARAHSNLVAVRLAAVLIGVIGGYAVFGVVGAIWGVAISYLVLIPTTMFYAHRLGTADIAKELLALLALLPGAGCGLVIRHLLSL